MGDVYLCLDAAVMTSGVPSSLASLDRLDIAPLPG